MHKLGVATLVVKFTAFVLQQVDEIHERGMNEDFLLIILLQEVDFFRQFFYFKH